MCEFSKIRSIENNRVEVDSEELWKSLGAHLYSVSGESGIHVTEVVWENEQKQKITIVHTTYRINNSKVIHYGFASPKYLKSPPKFWGDNIDFILQNKIGEKLKEIFNNFVKQNEIELPKYERMIDSFANWRESRHDSLKGSMISNSYGRNKSTINLSRECFGIMIESA
jgi:hypothetical protein